MMSSKAFVISLVLVGLFCNLFSFVVQGADVTDVSTEQVEKAYGGGTVAWNSETNAETHNTLVAYTDSMGGGAISEYLYVYHFDFADTIGATYTIDGIVVTIDRKASIANYIRDNVVSLVDSTGAVSGDNKYKSSTYYGTALSETTYGGSTDTWGGYDATDVRDDDFGVVIACENTDEIPRTASVDYISVTIYYTSVTIDPPTSFSATAQTGSISQINLAWTKDDIADATLIRYSTSTYPTTISDGTFLYNSSGSSTSATSLSEGVRYYFSAWSYDTSLKWSSTYATAYKSTYTRPVKPSGAVGAFNDTNTTILWWVKGVNATTTRVQYSLDISPPPTQPTWYVNVYNGSYNHTLQRNCTVNHTYHYSLWSWDNTAKLYSQYGLYLNVSTNISVGGGDCEECEECNSSNITVFNNTAHTSGKYQTSYSNDTGWEVWINFTGELPVLNHFENIVNASGTHEHNSVDDGYSFNIWANYSGDCNNVSNVDNSSKDWLWISGLSFESETISFLVWFVILILIFLVKDDEALVILDLAFISSSLYLFVDGVFSFYVLIVSFVVSILPIVKILRNRSRK